MSRKQWRCFHCDEVFISPKCAAAHFGYDETKTVACQLKGHERHLVDYIRDLESQLDGYRADDSHVMRSIYTLEADHRQALIRAEEDGYNKGVRDMSGPSDGAIYAAVSRRGMPPEELASLDAAVESKLAPLSSQGRGGAPSHQRSQGEFR